MKKILFFLSSLFFCVGIGFSNEFLEAYYSDSKLPEDKAMENYVSTKEKFESFGARAGNSLEFEQAACDYIDACTVLSCFYANSGFLRKGRLIKGLQKEVEKAVDFNKASGQVLLSYGDLIFSEFFWKTDNADLVQKFPMICRRVLEKDKGNIEAQVKLAMWHIFPATKSTNNWNSFIKSQEKNIETLNKYDRFRAYIQYSTFYMNNFNVEKGFMYLDKAKELFPNNVLCAVLKKNYSEGKLGL